MELEPEPELFISRNRNLSHNFFKSRNRNHNFSKVVTGTGTVKNTNSYGSTTPPGGHTRDKEQIRLRYLTGCKFKGTVSRDGYIFEGLTILNSTGTVLSVYALMVFMVFQKLFSGGF
jgi:hypothetical protein